jgi:uncharacterized protein (DUF3820 family)
MIEKSHLLKIANMPMPFGRYQGRVLIDLPEEYLLWFSKKGFPKGELGELLQLTLSFKIDGSDSVIKPLKGLSITDI